MENKAPRLILASGSPRRRELLAELGLVFEARTPEVEEELEEHLPVQEAVVTLALRKAESVHAQVPGALVIAADTVVILEGQVLGKPRDEAAARDMLRRLRGRWHEVVTGLVVMAPDVTRQGAVTSRVKMRSYSDEELEAYVRSGDPLDKAGAYAIQNKVFDPVERVEGSWTNVMGLPLDAVYRWLVLLGIQVPARPGQFRV